MASLFPKRQYRVPEGTRVFGVEHDIALPGALRGAFRAVRGLPTGSTVALEGYGPARPSRLPPTRARRVYNLVHYALGHFEFTPDFFETVAKYARRKGHSVLWMESPRASEMRLPDVRSPKHERVLAQALAWRRERRQLEVDVRSGRIKREEEVDRDIALKIQRDRLLQENKRQYHRAFGRQYFVFARWRSDLAARFIQRNKPRLVIEGDAHAGHHETQLVGASIRRVLRMPDEQRKLDASLRRVDVQTSRLAVKRFTAKTARRVFNWAAGARREA